MNKLSKLLNNLRDYFRSILARKKRKKKEDEDPFIYPHY